MITSSEDINGLYSYMQELHRAAMMATKCGKTGPVIEIRRKLARVTDRYRKINQGL